MKISLYGLSGLITLSALATPSPIHSRIVDLTVIVDSPQLPWDKESFGFAAFSYLVTGAEEPSWNLQDYCGFATRQDGFTVCEIPQFDIGDLIGPEEGGKGYYAFGLYRSEDMFTDSKWLCHSDGENSSVFDLSHLRIDSSDWNSNPKAELRIRDCQAVTVAQPH